MDSFLFHPARPSFHRSFSVDSEVPSCGSSSFNPCPSNNSSILSGLLHQETPSIPQSSFSQDFGTGPKVMFLPPPAQLMEDPSVHSGLHTPIPPMGSLNLFGCQQNIMEHPNPPVLSPIPQNPPSVLSSQQNPPILSPVQQVLQTSPPSQQNPPFFHPFGSTVFSNLQRFFADFSFPPQIPDTGTTHLFNLASATTFLGGDAHFKLQSSINR